MRPRPHSLNDEGVHRFTPRAVKRKHLAQNKEIIQKNSELHKCALAVLLSSCRSLNFPIARRANADLQRQISLMRAERLSLKGTQFQLECENAALRDKLDRCEERERRLIDERDRLKRKGAGVLDDGQVEVSTETFTPALAGVLMQSRAGHATTPGANHRSPPGFRSHAPLLHLARCLTCALKRLFRPPW